MTKEQLKQARQQLGLTQEADDAKDGADARLKALEIAVEDLGFKIEPITTKQDRL